MELKLKSDTKRRKMLFTANSFSHPAKMALGLQEYLLQEYTKEGEIVLDPMSGSGTILIGTLMGRHIICVELEQKFCRMMGDNAKKLSQMPLYLGTKERGSYQIIQGDARNLEGLMVDCVLTSPPYASAGTKADENPENYIRREEERLKLFPNRPKTFVGRYSGDPNNLGNLPYGQIDKIVSSPPYIAQTSTSKQTEDLFKGRKLFAEGRDPQQHSKGQIGDLPYGSGEGYAESRRPYADCVISSPPYSNEHASGLSEKTIREAERIHNRKYTRHSFAGGENYGTELNNIGNLKSTSYLEAMLQVYSQCWKVLRDGGLLVLVTKNFLRDRKEIRLDLDTIKLCEQAGFTLQERHHRKLTQQSFWRVIYKQKYPDAPVLDREDILLFRKGLPK